jgi:predicted peptidase
MIRSTVKIQNIWCVIYKATVPSDNWLIFGPGLGEVGPPDGSQLSKVDTHGYPKLAKDGFEFPFNIIVPQIHNTQYADYWLLTSQNGVDNGWFVNYVKESLGASKIVVTGLSLGGRGTWTMLKFDPKNYIDAIAPVCGFYESTNGSDIKNLRSVPGYSWHNERDTVMSYKADLGDKEPNSWSKIGVTRYNYYGDRPTQVIDGVTRPCHYLNTLTTTGVDAHADAWIKAYEVTPGKDSLLTWIKQQFGIGVTPIPQPQDDVIRTYYQSGKIHFVTKSGLDIVN